MKACIFLGLGLLARLLSAEEPVTVPPTKDAVGIYDADRGHLWNRLHAAFYQREVETIDPKKRASMGPEILDPPLGIHPRYLLNDEPFARANAVLEEFLSVQGEKMLLDPLKRAVLQRDLWAVFDLLQAETEDGMRNFGDTPAAFTLAQQDHRATLSRKVARVIAALALPRAQLEALPQTYALAVKSGAFPTVVMDQDRADYLPADLFAKNSPWMEASNGDRPSLHTLVIYGRSVFRIFYRPPMDAEGALKFAEWVAAQRKVKAAPEDSSGAKWESVTQSLPLGTQFLLLREMVCIDKQWNLVATPVVESVQVRVYRLAPASSVGSKGEDVFMEKLVEASSQLYEEFELDRRRLFRGESGGLRATPAGAPRHMGYSALGRLAVNGEGRALPPDPFPVNCLPCHLNQKSASKEGKVPVVIASLEHAAKLAPPPWADTSAKMTTRWKAAHRDFQRLRELATGDGN